LTQIPSEVFEIANLRYLRLSGNHLTHIDDDIARLADLRELDLRGNPVLRLPDTFGELADLEKLLLGPGRCRIPASIARCQSLRVLDLSGFALRAVPGWLASLHELEELVLSRNELDDLPDWEDAFPRLRVLDVSDNHLSRLPASFAKLVSLKRLYLRKNNLSDLPLTLGALSRLQVASLGFNRFTSVPEVVTRWANLEVLDLNSSRYTFVEVSRDSGVSLRHSNVDDRMPGEESPLTELHSRLRDLTNLRVLLLYGNPLLGLPAELLGGEAGPWQGSVPAILNYYFRTRRGARPLNEAKLILLGWGGVGKTSLVNRLVHDRFDPGEVRTEGIEVTSWPVTLPGDEPVRLNVWDFGGQEIMHATHQFFLTTRSLYLVVLSGRAGSSDNDADYWLRIVGSFASDSPVIVVLNQVSRDPFDLDQVGLRQKFPNIRAFVRTDCADETGLDELLAAILDATGNLADLRVSFPAAWFDIKDRLAGMSENYLTFDRYREICQDRGEVDGQAQEQLADYLHSLGIALNYRDDPRLRDTHVLNPHWVTEGIYAILNSRLVSDQHGEVTVPDLAHILDPGRYPRERHVFLLDLMRRFELCFPYTDEPDKYLVADLLPKQQPEEATTFGVGGALRFEYRYPVLPEGLVPRFIVRSHVHSIGLPRWRNGALLRWEENDALIQSDSAGRVVRIFVAGPAESRRRLLAVIRSDFEHIHRSYRFKVNSFVPIETVPGLAIEYDKLLAAEQAGLRSFPEYATGRFVDINVAAMLEGVDLNANPDRLGADRRSVKMFVSYSHQDERHRETLESHLKVLSRVGLLDVWHDRRIDPGGDWRGEIDATLEEADVVVLLVSADFLASDYCADVELWRARERRAAGACRVVPVIVRDCNWKKLPELADLQALPGDGRPITTWPDTDTAWRTVADGLEQVITALR
jgi:internalin A